MSHFLFIRNEPIIPGSLREVFSSPQNRLIIRQSAHEAGSALSRGAFDAVIIYSEGSATELTRTLRAIRDSDAQVFTLVIAPDYDLSFEKAAFDQGADLYFVEPISNESLARILSRQVPTPAETEASPGAAVSPMPTAERPGVQANAGSTLKILRDLSHILSFSLDYKAFTQQFILKLRDHISFSRIGIFLESSPKQTFFKNTHSKHLTCVASLGLPADLLDCFQLSREVGIGRELMEHTRILHKNGHSQAALPQNSESMEKEFSVLGCHLAIPITDREYTIGLAVLNGPVTGRAYTEDELELLYLLMEELGLAVRNSRLHGELAEHGQLIENVMHSMSSGAIVFGEALDILYINDAAKHFLKLDDRRPNDLVEFAELPAQLAVPVHRAVEKGEMPKPFKITGLRVDDIFQVTIFPFTQKAELMRLPRPTMVILEDFTQIEANKETALADSKSKLIRLIAERFAHEIRNSLVPLSTHAQLIDKKIEQPKFQASLKSTLLHETARIKRFSEQMLYLAQSSQTGGSNLILDEIIKRAYERARSHCGNTQAKLEIDMQAERCHLEGNSEALTYAFEELFHNSMQSEPGAQTIRVQITQNKEGILRVHMRDGGPGFTDEAIEKACEAFFTTRHTGVGLGLSVSRKVISEHHGCLHLNRRSDERNWDVEIELPLLLNHA